MTDKRKAYEEKFDAQLKEWGVEIALLNAKADKARAEVKIEYYKTIETLQGKQEAARKKLQELRPPAMMHGRTSTQARKTSGLKSRHPSKTRPQGSNEVGRRPIGLTFAPPYCVK